ncbi:MAG TPA: transglycosylase domain-containing protein [Solirubrobacterales bacterium]|jgi:penicillin-binding protein 1A|nr:transglycosylase domain-containing protein [Solirubrobacterales bacterium]
MATRTRRRRRRPQKKTRWHKIVIPIVLVIGSLAAVGGIAAAWALNVYNSAPKLSSLKPVQKGRTSAIFSGEGKLIGYIHSDNVRQPITGDEIPQVLKNATVSIEDKDFWSHGALDYAGIARAAWKDVLAGGQPVQGASTITQQLVRNLYIRHPEDTLKRKIKEAHLAEELFEQHSRRWILNSYLNTAPYGTNDGQTALGVEAASQTYFNKAAAELNLTEAAMIAGLPQAPSEYNPFLDPKAALQRRNEVLGTMWEQGYITRARYLKARTSGLGLDAGHRYTHVNDEFLYRLVEQELIERYGINTVRNGGLKAYTTIDPELQADAESAVATCSETGLCWEGGGPVTGLASVDPKTGAILALASTPGEEGEEEFNYAWQAKKQPGSSFKPYVLATAIKQGIDPKDTYYDGTSPMTLEIPGGGTWTVNNDEPGGGTMSLETATWDSINVVYAQLDLDVGPENVTQTAHEMGIEAELQSVPAEAIGGLAYGVSPLEQADGYATIASGGVHHDPTAISKVVFPDGKVEEIESEEGERALTPGQAYDVTNVLKGVISEPGATGNGYTNLESGCSEVAGKTGTSEEESDAWFVGYTPEFSTAVWVGHPRSRERTGFGGPTAGPIWKYYMDAATAGGCPAFEEPESLPELSALDGGHTASGGYHSGYEEEGEYEENEFEEGEEEGAEETEEAPVEEAPEEEVTHAPAGGGVSPG